MNRPTGVTILAILAIVGGVIAILGAIAAAFGALAIAALGAGALAEGVKGAGYAAGAVIIALVLAVWLVILGVLDIIFGIGALRLRGWAWTLGVVLMILNIVSNVGQLFTSHSGRVGTIIGIAIAGLILYYLFTPDVKAAFGKSNVGPTMAPLQGQSSYQPPAQQPTQPYQPPAQQPYSPPAPPAQQPYAPPAPPAEQPAPQQQPPAPPAPPA